MGSLLFRVRRACDHRTLRRKAPRMMFFTALTVLSIRSLMCDMSRQCIICTSEMKLLATSLVGCETFSFKCSEMLDICFAYPKKDQRLSCRSVSGGLRRQVASITCTTRTIFVAGPRWPRPMLHWPWNGLPEGLQRARLVPGSLLCSNACRITCRIHFMLAERDIT